MSLIVWDESLSVNHTMIDEQHKTLVDIINRLDTASTVGVEQKDLRNIFRELFRYTTYHFTEEENLMLESASKLRHAHMLEHKVFIDALNVLKCKFDNGEDAIVNETIKFLTDWFRDHISVTDKKLASFNINKSVTS